MSFFTYHICIGFEKAKTFV